MNYNYRTGAVVGIVALWVMLATWRETATVRIDNVEKRALQHYAALAAESQKPLHPVRWGNRVLVPKDEHDQREYAETYLAADGPLERMWLVGGDVLGRVPAATFHGAFAFATGLLVALERRRAD